MNQFEDFENSRLENATKTLSIQEFSRKFFGRIRIVVESTKDGGDITVTVVLPENFSAGATDGKGFVNPNDVELHSNPLFRIRAIGLEATNLPALFETIAEMCREAVDPRFNSKRPDEY